MSYALYQLRCKATRWVAVAMGIFVATETQAVSLVHPSLSQTGLGTTPLQSTAATLINGILSFLGIVFIAIIIWGGITWMTSGGNEEKVGKAQSMLRAAIIGLLIVLGSYGISLYVFTQFEFATGAQTLP